MNKIGIIGVPLKHGQSVDGVQLAPDAFRKSELIDLLIEKKIKVKDFGNIIFNEEENTQNLKLKNLNLISEVNLNLKNKVNLCLEEKYFPIIIGGDHSLGIGSIAAISLKYDNLGVIWYDAHTDINTEDTTPSGNIHGMSLACLLGLGHKSLTDIVSPKLKHENIVIIGARSIDEGEILLLKKLNIKVFNMDDIKMSGIDKVMDEAISYLKERTKYIHLSFDLDSLDPVYCPGVGLQVEDGISINDTLIAFNKLKESNMLVGMDVVEYNPLCDINNITLNNAIKMITEMFNKN